MIVIKKVLVATDFSPASDTALRYGREIAAGFHATLELLHVTPNLPLVASFGYEYTSLPPRVQEEVERAERNMTERWLTDEDRRELHATAVTLVDNNPAAAIVAHAKATNADVIVVGTHGRGAMAHMLLGSVAERVVRLAPCPVLTVHHPEHEFVAPDALMVVAQA